MAFESTFKDGVETIHLRNGEIHCLVCNKTLELEEPWKANDGMDFLRKVNGAGWDIILHNPPEFYCEEHAPFKD